MIRGTFVLGIFILPLATIFYVGFMWLLTVSSWKMYEYMMDATDDVDEHITSETISLLRKVPKYVYFIFTIVLFFFFYSPSEIVLKGKIESDTGYSVDVSYRAERGGFFCTSWTLFGGYSRYYKYDSYFPTLNENEHYLSISTSKFSFPLCDYQIDTIKMNVKHNKILLFEKKANLVYTNKLIKEFSSINRTSVKLIKVEKNHYTLDIGAVHNINNNRNTKKRSSYIIKKKNPFTTEEGIITAYGPDYDRSRDYEKEYEENRIRF